MTTKKTYLKFVVFLTVLTLLGSPPTLAYADDDTEDIVENLGWVAVGSVFARLEAMSGREALASEAGVSRVPYRITVPAAPFGAPSRPTARQRFRHGARIFEIVAVRETGQARQFLECHAIEETTV